MPIPQSKYVDITSAVANTQAVANKELIPRVLTTNENFAYGQVYEFTSASDVGSLAGYSSPEYAFASIYFGWVSKTATSPKKLSFFRYRLNEATAPFLNGVAPESVEQLAKVNNGSITVYLGDTSFVLNNLNFSSAQSYAEIAQILQTALQANTQGGALYTQATVSYTNNAFLLTGGVKGANNIALPNGQDFNYNAYPVENTTINLGYTSVQGSAQSYVPELTQIIANETLDESTAQPNQWLYTGVSVTSYEVKKENQTGYTTVQGVQNAYVTEETQIYLDAGCTAELAQAGNEEWAYVADEVGSAPVTQTVYNVLEYAVTLAYTSTVAGEQTTSGYTLTQTQSGEYVQTDAYIVLGTGQQVPALVNQWKANGQTAIAYELKNMSGLILYSKVSGTISDDGTDPLYTDIRCENQAQDITASEYKYTGKSITTYNVEAINFEGPENLFEDSALLTPLTSQLSFLYYGDTVVNTVELPDALGWTDSATISNGMDESTINQVLDNMVDLSTNFLTYGFLNYSDAIDNLETIGAWNDEHNNDYRFCFDVSAQNYQDVIETAKGFTGLTAHYNINYGSGVPAWIMSAILPATTNYSKVNGVKSYMFQQFPSIPVSVGISGDGTLYQTLDGLNINYNGQTQKSGSLLAFFQDGFNTNGVDTAIFDNEAWLKDSISTDVINMFIGLDYISADKSGLNIMTGILNANCEKALNNHVFAIGKTLNLTAQAYITQLTNDENAWLDVQNKGYWFDITINTETTGTATKYIAVYTLIYSKNDTIRKVIGSDILI